MRLINVIKISNDLVKENDQLKLENEKLKRQIHRLKTCCVEAPRMEEDPDVLSSKKTFMEEALLEEDELNEILEEINNLSQSEVFKKTINTDI